MKEPINEVSKKILDLVAKKGDVTLFELEQSFWQSTEWLQTIKSIFKGVEETISCQGLKIETNS